MNAIVSQTGRPSGARDASLVWQLVDRLDEQRRYPRIPLDTKIALVAASGAKVRVEALNISPDGLQVRCGVAQARELHPGGGRVQPDQAPSLRAVLKLDVAGGGRTLVAPCRLLYLTMVDSEPRCVLGLGFAGLDGEAQRIVSEFFTDQFAPVCDVA